MSSPRPAQPPARARSGGGTGGGSGGGVMIGAAVFLLFAPIGLLVGLVQTQAWGWGAGLAAAVFSGLNALVWQHAFSKHRWWVLIIGFALPFIGTRTYFPALNALGLYRLGADDSETARKLTLALMAVVLLSLGFTLMVMYIRRGERSAAAARAELEIAGRMHESIVPEIDRRLAFAHVIGVSAASSEMGGDLIDLVERQAEEPGERGEGGGGTVIDLILADVSGHGVAAGLIMGMLKGAVRARLVAPRDCGLDDLARDLNRVLEALTPTHTFVTAALLRIHADRRVSFALAGHLPILHRRADGTVSRLENRSLPLGVDPGESFPVGEVRASPGDVFVVFTDGLTEAADADGRQLGFGALEEIVRGEGGGPPGELVRGLMDRAKEHSGGTRGDDQSVLIVRME